MVSAIMVKYWSLLCGFNKGIFDLGNLSFCFQVGPNWDVMERLKDLLDVYLTMKTNYALLVTGEWGAGKIYYFQNNF